MYSGNFEPFNRYIRVRPTSPPGDPTPTVLVPDDYKVEPKYKVVEVVSCSDSCSLELGSGEHIVVESSMVEELSLNGANYYLVLENYVLATLGVPKNEA